jgi:6-phosphofructokinase
MSPTIRTIGIANGGGDCPGLNAVIRGAVRAAILGHGWQVVGITNGFDGLIWTERTVPLTVESIAGILPRHDSGHHEPRESLSLRDRRERVKSNS